MISGGHAYTRHKEHAQQSRDWTFVLRALATCFIATWLIQALPLVPNAHAQGAGDLMVTPTRVVFEGRTRTAEIALIHRGTKTATYRLSFQNMRMNENGNLEPIKNPGPGDRIAENMIRYSPRQVVLKPGAPQTIRLLLRKPHDLPQGEYRSHLLMRALPPKDAGTNIEQRQRRPGEISVQLTMIYGVSIPVIVRNGNLSAKADLSDLAVVPPRSTDDGPGLALHIHRTGDKSIYGDFEVTFMPNGGSDVTVGKIRGVAVYTPNESRNLRIPLTVPDGMTLKNGHLHVAYRSPPDSGGAVLAEREIAVP